MNLKKDVGRLCGECNACCKPFPVPEVGKHNSQWCPHVMLGKGCAIYKDRPIACQLYACLWLNGISDDNFRPDRLGVLVDCRDVRLGERQVGVLEFFELRSGALEQESITRMAEDNKDAGFIVGYHRMQGDDEYTSEYTMRRELFNDKEFELMQDALTQ